MCLVRKQLVRVRPACDCISTVDSGRGWNTAKVTHRILPLLPLGTLTPCAALIVSTEHPICDGISMCELVHELLLATADPSAAAALVPLPFGPVFEVACGPKGAFSTLKFMLRLRRFLAFPRPTSKAMFPVATLEVTPLQLAAVRARTGTPWDHRCKYDYHRRAAMLTGCGRAG